MQVRENPTFTRDYYDLDKRYIGNSVEVAFKDGTRTDRVEVSVPIGHRERRTEGVPLLLEKYRTSISPKLPAHCFAALDRLLDDAALLHVAPVHEFMELLIR
jgi:2-methylcitrate dehydratase